MLRWGFAALPAGNGFRVGENRSRGGVRRRRPGMARTTRRRCPALAPGSVKASILRRMVRGLDDNTIGESGLPAAIVRQERMRNHQGRRIFVPCCDHHLDSICRQHLKRGCAGRDRQRLGVASQKQRAIGTRAQWDGSAGAPTAVPPLPEASIPDPGPSAGPQLPKAAEFCGRPRRDGVQRTVAFRCSFSCS